MSGTRPNLYDYGARASSRQSASTKWVLAAVGATVVGLVTWWAVREYKKRHHHNTPSAVPAAAGAGGAPARYVSQCQAYRAAAAATVPTFQPRVMVTPGVQTLFQGSGPAAPDTYTFTTAGPRYGATMGALPSAVQAINSPVANWVGSFAPIRTSANAC